MSEGEIVAEGRRLTKRFGATVAVDAVDVQVRRGEILGLLGPNGAGKTTTTKLLLGLLRPTAGEVRLFGEPFRAGHLARVGAMVEGTAAYPYLSARDNLRVLARMGEVAEPRVEELLAQTGLAAVARRRFGSYSMGMKQRLGLAAALLRDPDILLLDEPTSGLDPEGQRDVHALIRRVAAEGKGVLFSSHQLAEVEQLCDRVVILREGTVAFTGTPVNLEATYFSVAGKREAA